MQDAPHDLRDYLFDELGPTERAEVEAYLKTAPEGRAELEQLRLTHSALLHLPEEEVPRRIAFVSDPILEPSPWRRFWLGWMAGAPRLALGAAAMLAVFFVGTWATKPTLARTEGGWSLAFGAPAASGAPGASSASGASVGLEEKFQAAIEAAMTEVEARQREAAAARDASVEGADREWTAAQIAEVRREMTAVHEDAMAGYELLNTKHETFKRQIFQMDMASLRGFGQ